MQTNFHNTTNLNGDELKKKDASAKSQEVNIYELMIALQNAVEWWTRDALNREYANWFEKNHPEQYQWLMDNKNMVRKFTFKQAFENLKQGREAHEQ